MASIIKKIKKGRPYYYAVESKRVGGKPRIVWQKYLGTLDGIVKRADESKPPRPKHTVIFQAGGVAALARVAQQLGLKDLIDEIAPKRRQGPTVGHYIVLAALNRALAPSSKARIGEWYEETVLRRLWGFDKSVFSSPRYWDHMDRISEQDIERIQEALLGRIKENFGLDPGVLLYDTTNFFTFLATTNDRSDLAQRGRNKQKRHDLRQVGLALLVTKDFQIPLFHHLYEGNVPDVSLFPRLTDKLLGRYRDLADSAAEATLVFDKGNVSDDAMEALVVAPVHFVAALAANRSGDSIKTPLEKFEAVDGVPGTRAWLTHTDHWGRTCRAAVVYTESFFTQQLLGVTENLVKCQRKLLELSKGLGRWHRGKARGKKPTVSGVKKSVKKILSAQFMKDLITTNVTGADESGLPGLQYAVDHEAFERLSRERLGRTVIVTDHLDWEARRIIETYRSLSAVEDAFKNMKNTDYLHWRPSYHWTDQKLRVHTWYCVLALLLSSLARKTAVKAGINLTLPALLEELTKIREVAVIYPSGTLAHRKDHIALTRMSSRQKKLAEVLEIGEILGKKG